MLASIAAQTDSDAVAAHLVPPPGEATELLASAGAQAPSLGPPGKIGPQAGDLVRSVVADLNAGSESSTIMSEIAPWSEHPYVVSTAMLLDSAHTCVLTVAGGTHLRPEDFGEAASAVGLLAQMVVLRRETDRLRQELHDVRQDRSLLAAGLNHDLKGPMTSILGAARTLITRGDQLDKDSFETMLASIATQAERLNRMLEETLQSQSGDPNAPVRSLATQIRAICDRVAGNATTARPGNVIVECPDIRIVTDPDRLERALMNLADNALKYAPPNTSVYVIAQQEGDQLVITVADNGPGVSPDVLPGLFSAYATDPGRTDGTGLGLHSVRQLVEELDGRVGYTRHSGWSRFAITLPARTADGNS